MKIWTLQTDSTQNGSIYITSEQEVLHYTDLFGRQFYTQKAIQSNWQDTLIYNLSVADFSKFIFSGKVFWICSEKAKQLMSPLVQKNAEFLPLIPRKKAHKKISRTKQIIFRKAYKPLIKMIHPEPHYLLNILDIQPLEVIDFDNSDFEYDEEKQEIYMTDALAFYPEKIKNSHLFKIMNHGRALQMSTFISDQFKKTVEQHQLTGLTFSELPEDEGGNLIWQNP